MITTRFEGENFPPIEVRFWGSDTFGSFKGWTLTLAGLNDAIQEAIKRHIEELKQAYFNSRPVDPMINKALQDTWQEKVNKAAVGCMGCILRKVDGTETQIGTLNGVVYKGGCNGFPSRPIDILNNTQDFTARLSISDVGSSLLSGRGSEVTTPCGIKPVTLFQETR